LRGPLSLVRKMSSYDI
jgi:hypothetical protein